MGGLSDLSDTERRLVRMVSSGEELSLIGKKHPDRLVPEKVMRSWGEAHTIHADVIRDILLGRLGGSADPRGIRLRGARISGRLDLDYVSATIPLSLIGCLLTEGMTASAASLPALILRGSRLEHTDLPALAGDRLTTTMLDISLSDINAGSEAAGILLEGADLGLLSAEGAVLTCAWGPAIDANECHIRRDALFSRFEEDYVTRRFSATGRGDFGAIRLRGARIDGVLTCTGSLANQSGPALEASGVTVGQSVFLNVMEAEGYGNGGAVRLSGARIGGGLSLLHATVDNDHGPAVDADGLTVGGDVSLRSLTATGCGPGGVIRLIGGHIGGQLHCAGATLTNSIGSGPTLAADGMTVGQDVFLDDGFTATGNSDLGVIRLTGARIDGQLVCMDASLTSTTGPAMCTDGLTVGQDLLLVRVTATGGGKRAVLDMSNTQVGGDFHYRPDSVTNTTSPGCRINVDGLTYQALPQGLTSREWLEVIRRDTPAYAAQPYQYLASALSAAGNDDEARDVLIAQRQDQLDRKALTGIGTRAWARFTGMILGYGYRPSRALLYLAGVVIASVVLAIALGADGALARPDPVPGSKAQVSCTVLQRVSIGLDLGEPLVSPASQCDSTGTAAGDGLVVARWILQVTAWALATLFIAGFTSAVRKT